MSQPGTGDQRERWTAEVLRRASAVLLGRMVGVWEVSPQSSLVPVATNVTEVLAWDATPEVKQAVTHLAMPALPGSRWVAGQLADRGHWAVAPVRDQVPAPPPFAQERRSRERLALELAGLCLGLSDHPAGPTADEAAVPDLFQRFTEQLGAFARDIGTPVAAARAAVARSAAAVQATGLPDAAQADKLREELRSAGQALEQAVALVRTVRERARAVVGAGGYLDVVQVVWSCVDAERAQAAARGATLVLKTLAYVVSIPGNADDLRKVVVTVIRSAVDCLQGSGGTVRVAIENVGPVVRLVVGAPSVGGFDPRGAILAEARSIVEKSFGGTLTVTSRLSEGTTFALAIPVQSHRFRDPALWWEG